MAIAATMWDIKLLSQSTIIQIQVAQMNRHILQLALCSGGIYNYIYIYISGNQNGDAREYCFRTLKIIFVVMSPSFIQTKFDNKHLLIE